MAIAGTLILQGSLTGAPEGQQDILLSLTLTTGILSRSVGLANGNNPFTVPVGTTALLLILPAGNAQTVTIKGVTVGDTGMGLLKTAWGLYPIDQTVTATINILTGGAIGAAIVYFL